MDEIQAKAVADTVRGTAWDSGGGIYLVRIERADGWIVVISDEAVTEYESEDDFNNTIAANFILLH